MRRLWPTGSTVFLGLILATALTACQICIPVVAGEIVDHALIAKDVAALDRLAAALVLLALGVAFFQTVHTFLFTSAGEASLRTLQVSGLSSLLSLPFREVREEHSGHHHALVTQDASQASLFAEKLVGQGLLGATQLIGLLWLLVARYHFLSLVVLLLAPVYLLVPMLSGKPTRRAARSLLTARAEVSSYLQESIRGGREVRAFGQQRWAIDRMLPLLAKRQRARSRFAIRNSIRWVNYVLSFVIGALAYWLGGRLVVGGELSVGELVTLVAILGYLEAPLDKATHLYQDYQIIRASHERLEPLLRHDSRQPEYPRAVDPSGPCCIKLRSVTFHYRADRPPALDNVSFQVEPRETVAIVGPSGSGKSTLVSLLLRLEEAQTGSIELNGEPIANCPPLILRAQVAVVPQESILFAGTIDDNIRMGRRWVSQEQVQEAARLANAHCFIRRLPQGYETQIGEGGSTLSGGQRQRLAIARAVLGNPGLLVLDEATAALDPESERAVRIGLEQASASRTTILVTHQMSHLLNVDRIILLQDGRVVAEGSHSELSRRSPLYSKFHGISLPDNQRLGELT